MNQFDGLENLNPYKQLLALRQKGTIDDYTDEFELIASMIPREMEALCLGYFMNGLSKEIKNWVRLMGLTTRLGLSPQLEKSKLLLKANMASEVVCDLGLSHVPYHPVFTNLGYPRPKHFGSTYNLNP